MLEPYEDKIVVLPIVIKESQGGILLPEGMKERGIKQGMVLAVGPGKRGDNGHRQRPNLNEGDRIAYFVDGVTKFIEGSKEYDIIEELFVVGRIR